MPTPAERQALLFLAAVLSLGTGVRVMRGRGEAAPPSTRAALAGQLAGQLAAVDSAIAARGRTSRTTGSAANRPARSSPPSPSPVSAPPMGPPAPRGETRRTPPSPVDLDTAPESVLVTLPGIGPALAKRIVQDRERGGRFGSITAFTRVAGIGEKTAMRLAPLVTFSSSPRRSP